MEKYAYLCILTRNNEKDGIIIVPINGVSMKLVMVNGSPAMEFKTDEN
jgi:hypothetical protein